MIYNQDEEEDFLSDKRVGQANSVPTTTRRRGGAYLENSEAPKEENDTSNNTLDKVILIIAVIVLIFAIIFLVKVFIFPSSSSSTNSNDENIDNTQVADNNTSNKNTTNSNKNSTSSNYAITSLSDTYSAYNIQIDSVVYKQGGNFYNNNEKIEGDKVYVEYKQISGLSDNEKQEEINDKLKSLSISLYDKNYLSDEDTLFIDIHTKLSVNFNTLSYLVIKTYEDIDGNRKNEKILSYNIRLDTLNEIDFEELFVDNVNIKNMYSDYEKSKVDVYYFDPQTIYIYNSDLEESKIDMKSNYTNIAIYNRYKNITNIFESSPTTQTVFKILDSTVSTETKDRNFKQK